MLKSLYIANTEAHTGKIAVEVGLMGLLERYIQRVGFFRPIIKKIDNNEDKNNIDCCKLDRDIELIQKTYQVDSQPEEMYACTLEEAKRLISSGRQEDLLDKIVDKYKEYESRFDFVLCSGTDYTDVSTALEFDINTVVAANIDAPVLLICNGAGRTEEEVVDYVRLQMEAFEEKGCEIFGVIVNRIHSQVLDKFRKTITDQLFSDNNKVLMMVPEMPLLGRHRVVELKEYFNAKVLFGEKSLNNYIADYIIGAMNISNLLPYIDYGTMVITPGDRVDILLTTLLTFFSSDMPKVSGILLTGQLEPNERVCNLIKSLTSLRVPILAVPYNTYQTAIRVKEIPPSFSPNDQKKINLAQQVFEKYINPDELKKKMDIERHPRVTPKLFQHKLLQMARNKRRTIVLPEGEEERILRGAEYLIQRKIVDVVLLGDPAKIAMKIKTLELDLEDYTIIEPNKSEKFDDYAQTYWELRKHKGITQEMAQDIISDHTAFGTMMVYKGDAHGMVSGSVNTTRHTLRPALEFVKTKPGISLVSSVFLMCLSDKVLIYGDCAVNPNPDAKQLAQIAISSAETAAQFGIEPRVAMLSYSTGESGQGKDVEKVKEAVKIVKSQNPDLLVEGPIQYDAAIEPSVAAKKLPGSQVAGNATVFIFPDLNTGNNTYKAVQRSAKAVAIGPVIQGLNKPVNDLSRGCTVPDIINTIAITAMQAGEK